jgi:serine/threonine protein phosphatase PrpC
MGALLEKPIVEKHTEYGKSGDMRYAASGMQGWRPEMEDTHIAFLDIDPALPGFAIYGVFDGHGGKFTSLYIQKEFLRILRRQEHFNWYLSLPAQSLRDHPIGLELLQSALLMTFLELDEDMITCKDRLIIDEDGSHSVDKSGSTACTIVVTPRHILCVNAGDSRAIYRTGGHTVQLSFDHKPQNEEERNRIEAAGGYVSMKRVDGDLAVSRGLGDFRFKDVDDLPPDLQKVTCIPDFVLVDRDPRHDEFILLACDGVWDVLSCRGCGDLLQTLFDEGENSLGLVVEELLDVCLDKQSKDNMTALLVAFPQLRVGKGGGVATRRSIRHARIAEEERKKKYKELAKQKLKAEAEEVRRRLAARAREREELDSESD